MLKFPYNECTFYQYWPGCTLSISYYQLYFPGSLISDYTERWFVVLPKKKKKGWMLQKFPLCQII